MYLSKLTIIVTQFYKCICLNCKMYLSKLKNAGLQRALSLALKMSAKAPSLTSCSPDSPQRLLEVESVWWNISRLGLRLAVAGWKQPARPMPPSLSSPITLPASPPLRLLWPYWPQLPKLSAALLFPPPPPSPSACSTGKRGPFLASPPVFRICSAMPLYCTTVANKKSAALAALYLPWSFK